jgi:hypothetical protein
VAINVTKCPSCNRLTPPKSATCLYCGKALGGAAVAPAAPEEPRTLGVSKARFRPQADDRGHYLIVESREPVTMDAGRLFVLGRDARTNLTIHASDVSRQHAEIDWQGDPPRPVLCEVRSRNGTFLNERLVTRDAPQPLRNGDRIRLGATFSLLYLNVPERDLKRELQERSQEETREARGAAQRSGNETDVVSVPAPAPAPAAVSERFDRERIEPPRPTRLLPRPPGPRRPVPPEPSSGAFSARRTTVIPSGDELESLVSAAMGEAAGALPREGDLSVTSASDVVRLLIERRASGVLSVFDGAQSGEVVLAEGQCQQAALGRLTGRPALQQVVRMRRGSYRFRPGDVTRTDGLADAPLPEDAPPVDPRFQGDLSQLAARDLVRALLQEQRTGTLTVFSAEGTGEASFVDGVCEYAAVGELVGREALDAICGLQEGAYRFRQDSEVRADRAPKDDLTSGWSASAWPEVNDWPASTAPAPPPPMVAPPPSRRDDPWEVDPNDTLMPGGPDGAAYRGARPAPMPLPVPAPAPEPPLVTVSPPGDGDDRVPPLRSPRGSPEPWSHTPLRGATGRLAPQQPPPQQPPRRAAPPPLPPPRDSERVRRQPPPDEGS